MKSFAHFLSLGHVTSIPAQPRLLKNLLWCRLDLLTGLILTTCLVDQDGWSSSPWTGLGQNRPENGPILLGHMGHLGPCMHADGLDEAGDGILYYYFFIWALDSSSSSWSCSLSPMQSWCHHQQDDVEGNLLPSLSATSCSSSSSSHSSPSPPPTQSGEWGFS